VNVIAGLTSHQPAPDAAAFSGKIELFESDDGRVDIDALVPFAVAVEMLNTAAAEGLAGLELFQADPGGPTLFTGQVPSDVLAAVLAPGERAGAKIVDGRGSGTAVDRAHRGKAKIKARLIADLDPDEWDLPPKPKWMRWRTYNRRAHRARSRRRRDPARPLAAGDANGPSITALLECGVGSAQSSMVATWRAFGVWRAGAADTHERPEGDAALGEGVQRRPPTI
jgi:hypothetical protein